MAGPSPYWASCQRCGAVGSPGTVPPYPPNWWPLDRVIRFMEDFARMHSDCVPDEFSQA
jgi:hypothetical protein